MSTAVSALRQSWLSDDGLILHVVARALELECQCDDPAPTVVQLRLSAENFDAEPAAQRARMGARAAKTPVCKGTARTRGCVSAADFIAAPERR